MSSSLFIGWLISRKCASVFGCLIIVFLARVPIASCAAANPTAQEVLSELIRTIEPPLRYKISGDPLDSVVYVIRGLDGRLSSRAEHRIGGGMHSLNLPAGQYECYPNRDMLFNLDELPLEVASETIAGKDAAGIAVVFSLASLGSLASDVTESTVDGSKCRVIQLIPSSKGLTILRQWLRPSSRGEEIIKVEIAMDNDSKILRSLRMMGSAGAPVFEAIFREVSQPASLPESYFEVPSAAKVLTPKEFPEYARAARPLLPLTAEDRAKYRLTPKQIDPKTGRPARRRPLNMTAEEFELLVQSKRSRNKAVRESLEESQKELAKSSGNRWWIYANVFIVMILLLLVMVRRIRRRS